MLGLIIEVSLTAAVAVTAGVIGWNNHRPRTIYVDITPRITPPMRLDPAAAAALRGMSMSEAAESIRRFQDAMRKLGESFGVAMLPAVRKMAAAILSMAGPRYVRELTPFERDLTRYDEWRDARIIDLDRRLVTP